jgi:uncharacterized membrane protein YbaN (DUF454 family)
MKLGGRLRQTLLITGGTIALGAAIVGIFVPILPTTPFLLLAAACYLRSSNRLYARLMNSRVFGSYVRDYYERKSMRRRAKTVTLILLWVTIVLSAYLSGFNPLVSGILLVVAAGVTIHIALLRTGSLKTPGKGEEPAGNDL